MTGTDSDSQVDIDSKYIPILIREARERNLSDEATRMVVGFEVASESESLYGVEYVAGELGKADATDAEKINAYIIDVLRSIEEYRENYERIEGEYGDVIDVLLS